jgi:hypothetical protein
VSTSQDTPYLHPRSLKGAPLALIALSVLSQIFCPSLATAQDGQSRNHNSASLQVNANIVPNVYLPQQTNKVSDPKAAVEYVLSPSLPPLEITIQTRDFTFVDGAGVIQKAVLVTTTVVLP